MTEPIAPVTGVICGAATWFLGALSRVRISGEQTGGGFAACRRRGRGLTGGRLVAGSAY